MILRKFLRDESGATAIEYGLIAACISIAIIVVAGQIGTELNTTFTKVKDGLAAENQ
jgi:pilus assembly protein Flp/PilA